MAAPTLTKIHIDSNGVAVLVWDTSLIGGAPGTQSASGTIPTSGSTNRDGQAYIGWSSGVFQFNGSTAETGNSAEGLFTSFGTDPVLPYAAVGSPANIGQPFYLPIVPAAADLSSVCSVAIPGILVYNTLDNPDTPNADIFSHTVPITSNYTGPRTQALVSANVPLITTVSGNTVRFTTRETRNLDGGGSQAFGRQVKRLSGSVGGATLTVNGTTYPCTSASTSFADFIDLVFGGVTITPGQSLTLNLPVAYLQFKHPNYTNTWNSVSESVSVVNNTTVPQPAIAGITANAAGTQLSFRWDQNVSLVDAAAALNFSLSSSLGVTRSKSAPVVSTDTLTVTVSPPLYSGEIVQAFNAGGQVRYPGSTGSNGLSQAYSGITVAGSTTPRPKPVLQTARISGPETGGNNGKRLELTYDLAIAANGSPANIVVDGTYPDVNTTFTFQAIESSVRAVYVTTGQIYAGDICTANIPANIVKETITGNVNDAVSNRSLTNSSTVPHPVPVLQSATIAANGQSIVLVYDINIVAGPNINSLRVVAEDDSTNVARTMLTSNPVISSNTLTLTIIGTVFDDTAGTGDSPVTCNTGSPALAGLVDSALAVSAGQHSYSAALTAQSVTNDSTIPEPAVAVIPTFAAADITTDGVRLKIRWVDASANPIPIRYLSALPTLSGSVTGSVTLAFVGLETSLIENDTTVFSIVPAIVSTDTVTLSVLASTVQSIATNTDNAASGPYVSPTGITNNSTLLAPTLPALPPIVQDVIVGLNGLSLGIYYDTAISPVGGTVVIDCSLSGRKTATVSNTESTLGLNVSVDTPVFIGEIVQVTIPYSLVVNTSSNLPSLRVVGFEAINNSTVPVPKPPKLDSATISTSGAVLSLVFDDVVAIGMGFVWVVGSKSGKHLVNLATLSPPSTVQFSLAGLVFVGEVVKLNLAKGVVYDGVYGFTPSEETLDFAVTNNSTVSLPTIATGLVQETT